MKLLNVIAASVLVFGATSCAMLKELLGDGTVFTTTDQLAEGQQGAVRQKHPKVAEREDEAGGRSRKEDVRG